MKAGLVVGLAVTLHLAMPQVPLAQQPAPGGAPQAGRGGSPGAVDPRVQQRTYLFEETNEQLPYGLFVSTKVSSDRPNPLIVSLHGLGGNQDTMMRESLGAVELAEQGGYILVTPMGYSPSGWYGIPPGPARGGGAGRAGAPAAAPPQATPPGTGAVAPQGGARGGRGGLMAGGGGTAVTDPVRVRELSEKDVMTVLEMVRKEFNVDERRIYLMGHSMGGAGTYYLGSKYGSLWAALAPIAPAAMGMTSNRSDILQAIKDADVPILVTMGDADEVVPVANVRQWVETMKELGMHHEYKEFPGVTHGPIMSVSMPDIYRFFEQHSRPDR